MSLRGSWLVVGLLVFAASVRPDGPSSPNRVAPRTDLYGDPLPDGAIRRLGTVRFRPGGFMNDTSISPDGTTLAFSDHAGVIHLADAASGKDLRQLDSHGGFFMLPAFSCDGRVLGACGDDGEIGVWEAATGRRLATLVGADGETYKLALSAGGRRLAASTTFASPGGVRVWDVASGKQLGVFGPVRAGPVMAALSWDGARLATWGIGWEPRSDTPGNRSVQLWDLGSRKAARRFQLGGAEIGSAAFSPDGNTLAIAATSGAVHQFDVVTATQTRKLVGQLRDASFIGFSADARMVGAAGDGFVALWQTATGERLATRGHIRCGFRGLALDGRPVLACGASARATRVWDVGSGKEVTPPAHVGRVDSIVFEPGGQHVVSLAGPNDIRRWDLLSTRPLSQTTLPEPLGPPTPLSDRNEEEIWRYRIDEARRLSACVLSSCGRLAVAVGMGKGFPRLYDTTSGAMTPAPQVHVPMDRCAVAVTPDARLGVCGGLVTGSQLVVVLWDIGTGKVMRTLTTAAHDFSGVAISADGKLIAAMEWRADSGLGSGVTVWDASTGERLYRVPQGLRAAAFGPDGTLAVQGYREIAILDARTGQKVRDLRTGSDGVVESLLFTPDGRTVAAGIEDFPRDRGPQWTLSDRKRILGGRVQLLEVATGEIRAEFLGHWGQVSALAVSADGRLLASGGGDTTVLLWDLSEIGRRRQVPGVRTVSDEGLWQDLGSADARLAYGAVWALVNCQAAAVPYLRRRLLSPSDVSLARIERLIRQLESPHFELRERATAELGLIGQAATEPLRRALSSPSPEVRHRVDALLRQMDTEKLSRAEVRAIRAIEVLEQIRTPDACQLLEALAKGSPEACLTKEAKASLHRLAQRPR